MPAEVVGLCAAATAVEVGERRDGFVRLPELGGWSAERYVAVEGEPAGTAPTTGADVDEGTSVDEGTTVTEPSRSVVEDGVTRTTTDEDQIGDGWTGPGGPRFQRWAPR